MWALDGVEWLASSPGRFFPGEDPGKRIKGRTVCHKDRLRTLNVNLSL